MDFQLKSAEFLKSSALNFDNPSVSHTGNMCYVPLRSFSTHSRISPRWQLHSERPDTRYKRGGARQSKEQHKRWYAHAFVKLHREGDTRLDTDQRVLELLNDILERGEYPDPAFPQKWFCEFRGKGGDFTRAFQAPELTMEHIKELAKQPSNDLPFRDLISTDP